MNWDIKMNFKNWYKNDLNCIACKETECTQQHALEYYKLMGKNELVTYIPEYKEIQGENVEEMVYISNLIRENLNTRKQLFE